MNLRRALLLFAIVLGLAALAAGLSRPSDNSDDQPAGPGRPTLTEPSVSGAPADIHFDASDPRRRAVFAGQAAEVYVEVDRPGQVVIPGLGLSAVADPVHARAFRSPGCSGPAATRFSSCPPATNRTSARARWW